jgi:pimeloyl-ACP methyl ester carboxylesterase
MILNLVGHSQGGAIALQLAIDYPVCVHSLSLLEPSLVGYISTAKAIQEKFVPVIQTYEKGDKKAAIDQRLSIKVALPYLVHLLISVRFHNFLFLWGLSIYIHRVPNQFLFDPYLN